MNASILRTVLALAIVFGTGVIVNMFANQRSVHGRLPAYSGTPTNAAGRELVAGRPDRASAEQQTWQNVQHQLFERGYLAKTADRTAANMAVLVKAAILAFEFDYNLALTAEPSDSVLKALIFTHAKIAADHSVATETAGARELVVDVQRALGQLGYGDGDLTGRMDQATRDAIAKFERARGLQASGRVSAPLIESLGPAFGRERLGRGQSRAG